MILPDTKNIRVLRTLIANMLGNPAKQKSTQEEIEIALSLVRQLTSQEEYVYVIADTRRIAQAFADKFGRHLRWLSRVEDFARIKEGDDIVVLHTGARTKAQALLYTMACKTLETYPNIVRWDIWCW